MIGDKRNFSLSIWDHKDNFLCLLKSANEEINGQSYDEQLVENIYGEKTLSFNIPAYIFDVKIEEKESNFNEIEDSYKKEKLDFIKNDKWDYIFNEQKIRYIEYDNITNKPIKIEEFVLKSYTESRNGYDKIIECQCESLAVYELAKIGWNINFNVDYITPYESQQNNSDLLTLDYWMQKIFYKETHLGRVSTTTECTYLLQGIQLRDEDGEPISTNYTVDSEGNYKYLHIEEPICTSTEEIQEYYNPTGWTWEVQSVYKNDPSAQSVTTSLYEEPTISVYNEVYPNQYKAFSYQKKIKDDNNNIINNPITELLPHPIEEKNYGKRVYVTDIKKRLIKAERSNVFSIIQTLCESFEVWAYFIYEYDNSGKISKRKILFKTEALNEDIKFDFSYGKNLISCSRNINSNELITKLSIPDTNSNLESDKILSIKQATANPTGEGYLYNFEYFYNLGILTKGEDDENSDEYKINLHNATIKSSNNAITRLQKTLVPLYDRQDTLQSELEIQQAGYTATIENIQSIQAKINAIEPEEREIPSWSNDFTQSNYVGELKSISTTTVNGASRLYLDFGREDVLYNKNIIVKSCYFDNNNNFIEGTEISITTYIPNYYSKDSFIPGTEPDPSFFIPLSENIGEPIYSDEEHNYIKGFIFNSEIKSYIRIRYKYAPLAYYYMLMRKYYNKLISIQEDINNIEKDLQYIKNKIFINELNLSNTLSYKNNLILQFEKKYKNFIREGYWEANDYQSQINPKVLDTNNISSFYEGLITVNTKLSDLNLNDSLNNYSYYIDLQIDADEMDFDSISMTTANPTNTANTELPRYRGNDYEVFVTNNNKVIIGISPVLIDSYKTHKYDLSYYKSTIIYNGENSQEYNWIYFNSENSPYVQDKYIYLTNDNILTDSIVVYGDSDIEDNLLTWGDDYTYLFDYAAYDNQGHRVPIDEQTSYSENIHYDYIIKIILKNTNKVNKFNSFIVKYNEENTLQFLYNDAVKTSHKYAVPQITYSISVLDISSLDDYKEYKPILGQKVPIYDAEMGLIGYQGIITSISKVLEKPEETNIEIATYQSRFEDIFQKLTSTMTEVKYNEEGLFNAADAITDYGTVKEEVFQKSLDDNNYKIQLGTHNDITIDKKSGITLVDNDDQSAVKIIGNGIFLTDNYVGNTSKWKTGITGNGINANVLTAGNIDTKNINIWNASEGQIRFIWNEQGLFAYAPQGINGVSTSTTQDFVDYNKYVKFNYDGLKFKDGDRSALSLGWDGLKMDTLSGALKLDADQGLILRQNNLEDSVTRLKLGKISDNSEEYGLKLYDSSGSTSFQSDSDGNLWLSRYINIGGEFSEIKEVPENVTAGIMGENEVPYKYQMGIMRDNNGDVYWNTTPIRFWAGPQTYIEYLDNVQITSEEVSNASSVTKQILNSITTNDPTLARFKVDANGNIVASGIDVGGWIGAGKLLRSKLNEAILRSDGYTTDVNNPYPVIAVGKTSNNIDGRDYNFRVYQNGDVKINNGEIHIGGLNVNGTSTSISTNTFKTDDSGTFLYTNGFSTTPQGTSISTNGFQTNLQGTSISTNGLQTNNQGTSLSTSTFNTSSAGTSLSTNTFKTDNESSNFLSGTMAGWNATSTGLSIITSNKQYGTFVNATTKQDGITFQSGKQGEPSFYVQNDGYVYAKNLHIEGGSINISGSGLTSNSTGTSLSGNKSSVNIGGLIASSTQTSLSTPSFKTDISNSTYLITGEVAGWTATSTGLEIITNSNNVTYKTAMYSKKGVSDTTFQSGPSAAPTFVVKNDGSVKADNIQITGNSLKNETDKIINTSNFSVTKNGKITATAGNIAGWEISTTTLSTTVKVGNKTYYEGIQKPESTTSIVFYAGENKSEPKFKVLADGTLFAEDAIISGTVNAKIGGEIAGFTIGQNALWNGKDSLNSTTGGVYLGTNGISLGKQGNEPAFKVTKDGYVEATNIKITGAQVPTYDTKVLEFTNANNEVIFSVTKEGKLSAKSGDLAGWTFTSTSINKENNFNNKNYKTGLEIPSSSTSKVFYAGTKNNPEFYIQADGTVVASKLVITSGTLGNAFNNVNNNITSLSTNINNNIISLSTNVNNNIQSLSTDINNNITSLSTNINNNITSLSTNINNNINTLTNNIVQQITGLSTDLNQQITNLSDGQIEVWYYAVDPTNSNSPAKDWNNNDKKEAHLGDLYYNTSTGEAFRYTKSNNTYKWEAIPEYSTSAQQLANQAQITADKKRTVFTSQPKGPYDIGDLWIINNNGYQVKYCISATTVENGFNSNDWQLAATDDTLAKGNIKSSIQLWYSKNNTTIPNKPTTEITSNTTTSNGWRTVVPTYNISYPYYFYCWQYKFADNTFGWSDVVFDRSISGIKDNLSGYIDTQISSVTSEIQNLQNQIDNQIEVWYYSNVPSNNSEPTKNWTSNNLKDEHIGDLYYDLTNKKAYKYTKNGNVYSWIETTNIGNAFYTIDARTIADNKRRIFTSQPTIPYDIGDLWVNGSQVKYSTTTRASGNYIAVDWVLTATDDTLASTANNKAETAQSTAETAQSTANNNIKYENQLWYASDSSTFPNKPTTKVTQNSSSAYKQWNLTIPTPNVGYPYYYYCFQRETADGTLSWSNVSYDSHSVGGFLASTTGLQLQKVNNYYIGMQPPANKAVDDVVIYAGTKGVAFTTNEFVVKANGNLKATNAEIIGNISASTGYIGGNQGFTIQNKKLYNGKSTLDGTSNGVYIGTDGISVGSNNKYFKAKNDGTITANGLIIQNGSISIGGFTANSTSTIIDGTNKDIRLNIPNFISNSNPGSGFTGQIAGWYAKEDRLQITKTDNNKTYGTLLIATTSSTGIAIQAGDIDAPAFTVKNDGSIISTSGTIGGWSITDSYLHKINTNTNNKFYVGLHAPSNSTDVVFYAGTKGESTLTNNEFYVRANGQIKATGLTLTADNISDFQSKVEQYAPDADVSSIGGFTNNNIGDSKGLVQSIKPAESTTTYYVGIKPPTSNNNVILYAGTVGEGSTSNTFYVRSDGYLKASSGNIGGWNINGSYLYTGSDINNNKFYVGMHRPTASTNIVFYAGTTNHANANDEFYVTANGYLKASSGNIGGWDINGSNLQKKNGNALTGLYPNSNNSNAVIFVGSDSNPNILSNNTKFKVTGQGDVYFNNNIYGWSNSQNTFKPGLNSGQITLPDSNGNQISVEINKGLIIDIR